MIDPVPVDTASTAGRMASKPPRELAMSAAWHGALTRDMRTIDGRQVTVIFHGHWSHGFGPDFSDAMIEIEGEGLVTGAVEIHGRSSEWITHGHHLDDRYNTVILHVVSRIDTTETRRADGKLVPVVTLGVPDDVLFSIDARLPGIWTELGGDVCAADLAVRDPQRLRSVIWRLGDRRLDTRVRQFEGELCVRSVGDVALRALFDAFGYIENRAPMVAVAERLILARIGERQKPGTTTGPGDHWSMAMVLGSAGFLPMSPTDAHISGLSLTKLQVIEAAWLKMAATVGDRPVPATAWSRARTRPANHPVARLMCAAHLLDRTDGDPFPVLLERVRQRSDVPDVIRELCNMPGRPAIGQSRAVSIAANVVLPLALAFSRHVGDLELEDAAS
ncbi:MAG TPA: DUF2851 family protein, partial [Thermomicrobiales bacterium]|nr:DUF2851 family protein [Thermomicrobiales bacterium]